MSVIIKLLSKFDDSGLKKAKSGFGGLKKTIGAIGIGIGISQITNLLLESAKAASADQKSTQLLNTQLVRNANATKGQIKQAEKFIEKLSLQTGIMDDDLRPSMGKFVRVTKDVNKAQQLLTLSLDAAATTGKPLEKVSNAISQAFVGNRKQLEKLFPSLKTSKDLFGDLEKIVGGAAIQQADPFSRFNNSMDILKEKLGNLVLPLIQDFVGEITKPGGAVEQIGRFFEQAANPKTDIGKAFNSLKESIKLTFDNLQALFGLMDPNGSNNPTAGFANALQIISDTIGTITDGLTVTVATFQKIGAGDYNGAIALLTSDIGLGAESVRRGLGVQETLNAINSETMQKGFGTIYTDDSSGANNVIIGGKTTGKFGTGIFANGKPLAAQTTNNNITINVQGADPKATVDALSKYVKQNGGLPFNLATAGKG
jgi:hypothetical protein